MRIAQVSPLYECVPPKLYGGTERVVSYLTEELVQQGHDVTLFASGDSITKARLVSPCLRALRLDAACSDPLVHHVLELEQVMQRVDEFDVVHFHTDYLHFPLARRLAPASVTTLHGRLDVLDLVNLYCEFRDLPLVSISNSQRQPLPWGNWVRTVYHGLPLDRYAFHPDRGRYLAFLGRLSPEKRPDLAVAIARRFGMELRIAAKVDNLNKDYYTQVVKPLLREPGVQYIGEIGEEGKEAFLGQAYALLFPIDWSEPFGLVLIESMACGTPIVAFRRGSVPELMRDGATGYVVDTVEEAVRALDAVGRLDRRRCRAHFERRFSVGRMARQYVGVYQRLARSREGRAIDVESEVESEEDP